MSVHNPATTLRFGTPASEARLGLILLHGRGASADDIAGLAESLPSDGVAFLVPDATGGSWYPQRFFLPTTENEPHLSSALEVVNALANELLENGLSWDRIGILGFSQGGCLALEYAVRHPRRYGLVAGLSSALIGPLETERPSGDLEGTPVLIACAERDPHIPLPFVKQSISLFEADRAEVTSMIFPGDGHWVYSEEIEWLTIRMA